MGLEQQPSTKRRLHLNLNFYSIGDTQVDSQPTPLSGRVVGEFDTRWAVLVDIGVVWDFLK